MARNSSASKQAALVDQINRYWGWTGLNSAEVVGRNEFGNFLVLDKDGTFWRICPKQLACDIVADTPAEFESLINDPEFNLDWQMSAIVEIARQKFGHKKWDGFITSLFPICLVACTMKLIFRQFRSINSFLIQVSGHSQSRICLKVVKFGCGLLNEFAGPKCSDEIFASVLKT